MSEITHDHLERLATRIEASVRREVDQLRSEVAKDIRSVHARVSELRDKQEEQNGKVGKAQLDIAELRGLQAAAAGARGTSQAVLFPDLTTKKAAGVAGAGVAGLIAIFELLHQVMPHIRRLFE